MEDRDDNLLLGRSQDHTGMSGPSGARPSVNFPCEPSDLPTPALLVDVDKVSPAEVRER
jgi:hypothetical protein